MNNGMYSTIHAQYTHSQQEYNITHIYSNLVPNVLQNRRDDFNYSQNDNQQQQQQNSIQYVARHSNIMTAMLDYASIKTLHATLHSIFSLKSYALAI